MEVVYHKNEKAVKFFSENYENNVFVGCSDTKMTSGRMSLLRLLLFLGERYMKRFFCVPLTRL